MAGCPCSPCGASFPICNPSYGGANEITRSPPWCSVDSHQTVAPREPAGSGTDNVSAMAAIQSGCRAVMKRSNSVAEQVLQLCLLDHNFCLLPPMTLAAATVLVSTAITFGSPLIVQGSREWRRLAPCSSPPAWIVQFHSRMRTSISARIPHMRSWIRTRHGHRGAYIYCHENGPSLPGRECKSIFR